MATSLNASVSTIYRRLMLTLHTWRLYLNIEELPGGDVVVGPQHYREDRNRTG